MLDSLRGFLHIAIQTFSKSLQFPTHIHIPLKCPAGPSTPPRGEALQGLQSENGFYPPLRSSLHPARFTLGMNNKFLQTFGSQNLLFYIWVKAMKIHRTGKKGWCCSFGKWISHTENIFSFLFLWIPPLWKCSSAENISSRDWSVS